MPPIYLKQFPDVLRERDGKLLCMVCNIAVEHKRKLLFSSFTENHSRDKWPLE